MSAIAGAPVYVIAFGPRTESRGLARGRAWIDVADFRLRRLEVTQEGREVSFDTYLHVREDTLQLYAFPEPAELRPPLLSFAFAVPCVLLPLLAASALPVPPTEGVSDDGAPPFPWWRC